MSKKVSDIYIENATRDVTIAYERGNDIVAAVVRKIDDNLYVINTRKGSYEMTGRTRISVGEAGAARDAVWCAAHGAWKHVTPSGALYCRGCSREYIKKRNAAVKDGSWEKQARKSKEERQQEFEERRAAERVAAMEKSLAQAKRRTEAFFLDSVKKYGVTTAKTTYGRYLSDEDMDALLATT